MHIYVWRYHLHCLLELAMQYSSLARMELEEHGGVAFFRGYVVTTLLTNQMIVSTFVHHQLST